MHLVKTTLLFLGVSFFAAGSVNVKWQGGGDWLITKDSENISDQAVKRIEFVPREDRRPCKWLGSWLRTLSCRYPHAVEFKFDGYSLDESELDNMVRYNLPYHCTQSLAVHHSFFVDGSNRSFLTLLSLLPNLKKLSLSAQTYIDYADLFTALSNKEPLDLLTIERSVQYFDEEPGIAHTLSDFIASPAVPKKLVLAGEIVPSDRWYKVCEALSKSSVQALTLDVGESSEKDWAALIERGIKGNESITALELARLRYNQSMLNSIADLVAASPAIKVLKLGNSSLQNELDLSVLVEALAKSKTIEHLELRLEGANSFKQFPHAMRSNSSLHTLVITNCNQISNVLPYLADAVKEGHNFKLLSVDGGAVYLGRPLKDFLTEIKGAKGYINTYRIENCTIPEQLSTEHRDLSSIPVSSIKCTVLNSDMKQQQFYAWCTLFKELYQDDSFTHPRIVVDRKHGNKEVKVLLQYPEKSVAFTQEQLDELLGQPNSAKTRAQYMRVLSLLAKL